jgi:DNA-binding HxlR family transcriptional regulator
MEPTFKEYYPFDGDNRKAAEIMGRYGDKWSLLVVMLLRDGPNRFNAIKRILGGISQQMLSSTLRNLQRDGMVTRTVFATVPPAVEYRLTDLGHSLTQPFIALGAWIMDHMVQIEDARDRYDKRMGDGGTNA